MFISRFDELRRRKAARENRDIDLKVVAGEIPLAYDTVLKVKRGENLGGVRLETIDKLLAYFGAKGIGELIEWRPSEEASK